MAAITKPDLGDGVSHPARFSPELIPVFASVLKGYTEILDPFAGAGRIHLLREYGFKTLGVEIEPEWAKMSEYTLQGNALDLPFKSDAFDGICTSPCYGNRMADHHSACDGSLRRSYTHDLGRALSPHNAGSLQWGEPYRLLHQKAWREAVRVLRPEGRFVLYIKDHIRAGRVQLVSFWHACTLASLGLVYNPKLSRSVGTPGLKQGKNAARRCVEMVLVFDRVRVLTDWQDMSRR